LERVAAEVRELGRKAWVVRCDLSDTTAFEEAVRSSAEAMGQLDVLINNAGGGDMGWFGPLENASHDAFDALMQLNLKSPFFGSIAAVKEMKQRETAGVILNIASIDGVFPAPGEALYGAAKAAMVSLTEALAIEAGQYGIRVNAIAPSLIDTPLVASWIDSDEKRADRASYFPINRLGTPDDIAAATAYLCSDEASWVSGVTLIVAGGQQATSDVFRWVRSHNPVPPGFQI
ncbi:MAG: SDR family NAD(P)-dependent oxidoreductase, partial [Acidimicrobiales bacterium]